MVLSTVKDHCIYIQRAHFHNVRLSSLEEVYMYRTDFLAILFHMHIGLDLYNDRAYHNLKFYVK